ncbi:secreted RxLR effector protein 161-like [Solanum dulcamara]|uniref:secreted RxLR effector protein 161-like n=1 Tax=Solanum dulcamara TaxID=45834 RepID=UPI002485F8A2|nr:secreted RxLR effector protein 161-like [Solanum dulcamara]
MERCKPVLTPLIHNKKISKFEEGDRADPAVYRSLIGSLLYLTATRYDLMFATSLLSRFMHAPSQVHLGVAKQTLRYIKGTVDYGIWFKKEEQGKSMGYSNSDWVGSVHDMKSTSGYAFTLGSCMFSLNSKKLEVVAQSSAEVKYIAAAGTTNQALWLRKILCDLEQNDIEATIIKVDNKLTISMAKSLVQHGRSKHINVKFHAIMQAEKDGEVKLVHCNSD